jgi:hypothetical protein
VRQPQAPQEQLAVLKVLQYDNRQEDDCSVLADASPHSGPLQAGSIFA